MNPEQYISQVLKQLGSSYDLEGVKKLIKDAVLSKEVVTINKILDKILSDGRTQFVNIQQAQEFTNHFAVLWNKIAEEVKPSGK